MSGRELDTIAPGYVFYAKHIGENRGSNSEEWRIVPL